jgi:hypothetical protein
MSDSALLKFFLVRKLEALLNKMCRKQRLRKTKIHCKYSIESWKNIYVSL